ncbi:MAG TPA: DUF4870 domain-containing protein [Thiothrix sp.]|nr:DUF4870 domain-containing protein [Thiothrix sp.]
MSKSIVNKDDKKWGMVAHLSALAGIIFPLGIVLGPLIVWLLKRNEGKFIDDQAKEALNFQITVVIISFVLVVLAAAFKPFMILAAIVGIAGLIFAVIAGLKAKEGEKYRYPFSFRFIK